MRLRERPEGERRNSQFILVAQRMGGLSGKCECVGETRIGRKGQEEPK